MLDSLVSDMSPAQTHRSAACQQPGLQITTNALTKKVKRIAHGMTNFRNWRVRVLLAAGRPDWDLLPHITPLPL